MIAEGNKIPMWPPSDELLAAIAREGSRRKTPIETKWEPKKTPDYLPIGKIRDIITANFIIRVVTKNGTSPVQISNYCRHLVDTGQVETDWTATLKYVKTGKDYTEVTVMVDSPKGIKK